MIKHARYFADKYTAAQFENAADFSEKSLKIYQINYFLLLKKIFSSLTYKQQIHQIEIMKVL